MQPISGAVEGLIGAVCRVVVDIGRNQVCKRTLAGLKRNENRAKSVAYCVDEPNIVKSFT